MADMILITLPNGLELSMTRAKKIPFGGGQDETTSELWRRFGRALKSTNWKAVIEVYGGAEEPLLLNKEVGK